MSERPKRNVWFWLGITAAVLFCLSVIVCGLLLAFVFFLDVGAATQ